MRLTRWIAAAIASLIILPVTAHAVPETGGLVRTNRSLESRSTHLPGFLAASPRVIVGDTLEIWRGGGRLGVGLIGADAAPGNTRCGIRASGMLESLVSGGVRLEGQPGIRFDARFRRMYYAFTTHGRSIALRLVRRGLAYAVAEGRERRALAVAEDEARAENRGCLWRSGGDRATTEPVVTGASGLRLPIPSAAERLGEAAPGPSFPSGFQDQVVASGFNLPTGFANLPDGRVLVAEKSGVVRVIKNGQVLGTPFIDISSQVNTYWDRGMVGIAADPNFATNGFVYLYFVYENNASDYEGTKTARLIRVTATGDTASPASQIVVLGSVVGSSCNNFVIGADCLPADAPGHSTGDIEFASDGTMFVSAGDGAYWGTVNQDALRSQNLDLLAGKLLHVTTLGKGLAANPFWTGNADANRSKVYAYGLRNAYRGTVRPGSNVPYFGDVGDSAREEVNAVAPGSNLGWPCWEGTAKNAYQTQQTCVDLYALGNSAVRFPLVEYAHDGQGAAVTGGPFYTGTAFPSTYQGAYFYADYVRGWIRYLRVDASDNLTAGPTDFSTTVSAPVDLEEGADGSLYYLSIYPGTLHRICYQCPPSPPPPPPQGYSSEVLADQPIGYWRLGETSGTTAADSSGNQRSGTYVNAPTLGAASLLSSDPNASVRLNGTNQYVEVPNAGVWNLTGDLTIEALVNVTGGGTNRTIVAKHDANGDVPVYEFRIQGSTGKLQFVQKTTGGVFLPVTGNAVLATGTTYHVAVTRSGNTVTLYVNGAVDKTQTVSGTIATNTRPVRIGSRDGANYLAGRIDEVAIYDKALAATRIATHYAAIGTPPPPPPP